jgi:hypothetical protein
MHIARDMPQINLTEITQRTSHIDAFMWIWMLDINSKWEVFPQSSCREKSKGNDVITEDLGTTYK